MNERGQRLRRDDHETRRLGLGRGESFEKPLLEKRSRVRNLPLLRWQERSGEKEVVVVVQDGSEGGFWAAAGHWLLQGKQVSAQTERIVRRLHLFRNGPIRLQRGGQNRSREPRRRFYGPTRGRCHRERIRRLPRGSTTQGLVLWEDPRETSTRHGAVSGDGGRCAGS